MSVNLTSANWNGEEDIQHMGHSVVQPQPFQAITSFMPHTYYIPAFMPPHVPQFLPPHTNTVVDISSQTTQANLVIAQSNQADKAWYPD